MPKKSKQISVSSPSSNLQTHNFQIGSNSKKQKIPILALVGLPNSGKSTLINRLCGQNLAPVDPKPNTTRDLLWGEDIWDGLYYRIVDTGGLLDKADGVIQSETQIRSMSAIAQADLLVWVIDRKQNPENISLQTCQKIWKTGKPFVIAINKVDNPNLAKDVSEYAHLGGLELFNFSAINGWNVEELADWVVDFFVKNGFEKTPPPIDSQTQLLEKNLGKKHQLKTVRQNLDGTYYVLKHEDGKNYYEKLLENEVQSPKVYEIKNIVLDFWGVLFFPNFVEYATVLFEKYQEKSLENSSEKTSEKSQIQTEKEQKTPLLAESFFQEKLQEFIIGYEKQKNHKTHLELKTWVEAWLENFHQETDLPIWDINIWGDFHILNSNLANFIAKNPAYNFYFLTDITEENLNKILSKHAKLFECFQGGLASCQSNWRKPNLEFYEELMEKYDLRSEETLFLDDKEDNLEAALRLGWWTFDCQNWFLDLIKDRENREKTQKNQENLEAEIPEENDEIVETNKIDEIDDLEDEFDEEFDENYDDADEEFENEFDEDEEEGLENVVKNNFNFAVLDFDLVELVEKIETGGVDRIPKIPKILFLGKPNVGKSTIFNALFGENVQIVSDIAGTTVGISEMLIERWEDKKG